MLKPAAAKKQLAQWRLDPDDDQVDLVERHLPAVKKLPKKLKDVGMALLGLDAGGERGRDWEKQSAFQSAQEQVLDDLSKRDRLRILRLFGGPLADDLEVGWQWMKQAPYAVGFTSTPFRAPHLPAATLEGRWTWLREMFALVAAFQPEVLTAPWLAASSPIDPAPAKRSSTRASSNHSRSVLNTASRMRCG